MRTNFEKEEQDRLPSKGPMQGLLFLAVFFVLHCAMIVVGGSFRFSDLTVPSFWPATGTFLAALVLFHTRYWLGVVVVALAAELTADLFFGLSGNVPNVYIYLAGVVGALVGVGLLRKFFPDPGLQNWLRKMIGVTLAAAVVGCGLGALVAAVGIMQINPGTSYWRDWQIIWFASALGALTVAPAAVLSVRSVQGWFKGMHPAGSKETLIVVLCVFAALYESYGEPPGTLHSLLDYPYVVVPFLFWSGLRCSLPTTALLCAVASLSAAWGTDLGYGPFAYHAYTPQMRTLALQVFLMTLMPALILLAASVTDRRLAKARGRHLEQQLERSKRLEMVGQLAGGVAHDYNNYLTVIQGYAELAELGIDGDRSKLDDALANIQKAVSSSSALTRQLLSFSRREVVTATPLDLGAVLGEFRPLMGQLLDGKVNLDVKVDDTPCVALVDRSHLEQILLNLVANARDAMPEGGKISVGLFHVVLDSGFCAMYQDVAPGRYLRISVRDQGTGMASETIDRIFDPLFTTKGEGKGTGLGLSTVYAIIRKYHGTVVVSSEIGVGSEFTIYLPAEIELEDVAAEMQGRVDASVQLPGGGVVLVAENESLVRALVGEILTDAGYRVISAEGGGEALAAVESRGERVDLLISDVEMPGMGGVELAEKLRSICPQAAVLYMSGCSSQGPHLANILRTEQPLLRKPFSRRDLLDAVAGLNEEG